MSAPPSPARKRAAGWWAFGLAVSALLAAFFVPVVHPESRLFGLPPLKLLVLALAALAAALAAVAHVNREDRRLYMTALAVAGVAAFIEYFLAALLVAGAIWFFFNLFG